MRRQIQWRSVPDAGKQPWHADFGAVRRDWRDYTVEFPAVDGVMEMRSGAGSRKCRSAEAVGADTVLHRSHGRTGGAGRFTCGRTEHCAWRRRGNRTCPGDASAGAQSLLYRLNRNRRAHHERCGAARHETGDAGAGR